jgi:hypothetical protein
MAEQVVADCVKGFSEFVSVFFLLLACRTCAVVFLYLLFISLQYSTRYGTGSVLV